MSRVLMSLEVVGIVTDFYRNINIHLRALLVDQEHDCQHQHLHDGDGHGYVDHTTESC